MGAGERGGRGEKRERLSGFGQSEHNSEALSGTAVSVH